MIESNKNVTSCEWQESNESPHEYKLKRREREKANRSTSAAREQPFLTSHLPGINRFSCRTLLQPMKKKRPPEKKILIKVKFQKKKFELQT
jgi:hypothetical protein